MRKLEYLILGLALSVGLIVRLYKIGNPIADWHSFRQADTASVSRLYVENGIDLLMPKYHDISRIQSGMFNPEGYRFVEFPIYNAIHALLAKNFDFLSLEIWGRIVSITSSLISALLIFKIAKMLYGRKIGLLSSSLYLILPFNIYFTRVILPEPMAIMFSLASLYCFLKYMTSENIKTLLISSVFLSLGILVKPYVIFYGFPLFIYFYKKFGLFGSIKKLRVIAAMFIILLPFIVWRIWMSQFPEGIPFWKWTFNGDGIRFRPAFFRWIFAERLGVLILGVWGLIPFSFGLMDIKKKDSILISLILGMLSYLSIFATANVRHDYYQSIIVPVIVIILAKGIVGMWTANIGNDILRKSLLLGSLILSLLVGATQIREFYKINHPEIIEAGNAVDRLTPKDSVVIAAYNGDTAFLYQTKRRGWPNVELPINELIGEGAQYYVSVNINDRQTQEFMSKFKVLEKTNTYVVLELREENEK